VHFPFQIIQFIVIIFVFSQRSLCLSSLIRLHQPISNILSATLLNGKNGCQNRLRIVVSVSLARTDWYKGTLWSASISTMLCWLLIEHPYSDLSLITWILFSSITRQNWNKTLPNWSLIENESLILTVFEKTIPIELNDIYWLMNIDINMTFYEISFIKNRLFISV